MDLETLLSIWKHNCKSNRWFVSDIIRLCPNWPWSFQVQNDVSKLKVMFQSSKWCFQFQIKVPKLRCFQLYFRISKLILFLSYVSKWTFTSPYDTIGSFLGGTGDSKFRNIRGICMENILLCFYQHQAWSIIQSSLMLNKVTQLNITKSTTNIVTDLEYHSDSLDS